MKKNLILNPAAALSAAVLSAALSGCMTAGSAAPAASRADDGKNCYNVKFASVPNDYSSVLRDCADEWNYNFRPYGASSEWLWSDSNVRRAASADAKLDDRNVTGLRVTCDEEGFDALVYCNEPALATYLAETNAFPSQRIEFFVAPGDADTQAVQQRYMAFYGNGTCREYENREPDRDFRLANPQVTETALKNSIVVRLHWDWANFWMRLPLFCGKADNFWRLSVIRWTGPGITWGGTVHQNSQAGYIRWPDFTPGQRTAILKRTLEKAWREFTDFTDDNRISVKKVWIGGERFRREGRQLDPQSYVNMNEDPEFRPTLNAMIAERQGLAAEIARFEELPRDQQDEFFLRAAEKLFNFPWAVQEAYARNLEDRIFAHK